MLGSLPFPYPYSFLVINLFNRPIYKSTPDVHEESVFGVQAIDGSTYEFAGKSSVIIEQWLQVYNNMGYMFFVCLHSSGSLSISLYLSLFR